MNTNNFRLDPIDPEDQAFVALAKLLMIMRLSGFVMASYAILQGTLIIVGGPNRFSQVGYITAMVVPGAPATWGWFIAFFGVVSFFGLKSRKYKIGFYGMFGAGAWSFAFGGAFFISAVQYPEANLTAMVTYGKDGVLFLLMAVVHLTLSKTRDRPEVSDA